MTARELPSGLVTFVFTDVVGSTDLFTQHGDRYVAALGVLQDRIRSAIEGAGGVLVSTEGDGAFGAFGSPSSALEALTTAIGAGAGLDPPLQLRAGAHTGEATPIDRDYIALPVHIAARVAAAAGAQQVLVSDELANRLGGDRSGWVDLGQRVLKGIPEPVRLWRVVGPDEPCRAEPARRTNLARSRTSFVGRAEERAALERLLQDPGSNHGRGTRGNWKDAPRRRNRDRHVGSVRGRGLDS